MKRFALTCMLKDGPGIIEKYEKYHAQIWPEVLEGGRRIGILRQFIYRIDRRLFMFFETVDDFDLDRDMARYASDPKAKEWDLLMRDFQTNVPEAPKGTTWVMMKEIMAVDRTCK